ncbi:MAG: hypothetical protein IPK78_20495 [Rhodospirillales bacterium]|nr:hypothetical protein [Rhodospirillales bacterium]
MSIDNNNAVMIGLHITKCAGTSLISTIRQHLSEDNYFFCSSFVENLEASRPLYELIINKNRLKIVFGHFVNESILVQKNKTKFFYLLDYVIHLHDPSHFRQVNAVREAAGVKLVTAGEFLELHGNGMCKEILRAFPSFQTTGSIGEDAIQALRLFDYIYDTDMANAQYAPIFDRLGLQGITVHEDNIGNAPHNTSAEWITEQKEVLRHQFGHHYAGDILLYNSTKDNMGIVNTPDEELRCKFLATIKSLYSETDFNSYMRRHLLYEFRITNKLAELAKHASAMKELADSLEREIGKMMAPARAP